MRESQTPVTRTRRIGGANRTGVNPYGPVPMGAVAARPDPKIPGLRSLRFAIGSLEFFPPDGNACAVTMGENPNGRPTVPSHCLSRRRGHRRSASRPAGAGFRAGISRGGPADRSGTGHRCRYRRRAALRRVRRRDDAVSYRTGTGTPGAMGYAPQNSWPWSDAGRPDSGHHLLLRIAARPDKVIRDRHRTGVRAVLNRDRPADAQRKGSTANGWRTLGIFCSADPGHSGNSDVDHDTAARDAGTAELQRRRVGQPRRSP